MYGVDTLAHCSILVMKEHESPGLTFMCAFLSYDSTVFDFTFHAPDHLSPHLIIFLYFQEMFIKPAKPYNPYNPYNYVCIPINVPLPLKFDWLHWGGGGGGCSVAPLNKFCRTCKTAALSAAPLHDFWSLTNILTPNLQKSYLPLQSHMTFVTRGQPENWDFVILCTKHYG